MFKLFIALCLSTFTLAACTPMNSAVSQKIDSDFKAAVQANDTAPGHLEWEASPNHPSAIFARWNDAKVDSKDVCATLTNASADDLSLFEEEIRDPKNAKLVEGCRDNSLQRVEAFLTADIPVAPSGFQFHQEVVTRDFSKGLFTTTLNLPKKTFLLTFDDGPHAQYTDQILATLKAANVKVVFFELGQNVKMHPEITRRVADAGHDIGTHSITHSCLADNSVCAKSNASNKYHGRLTYQQAVAEIVGGHQAVYDVLGWVAPYFRFPYGESSKDLKNFLATNGVGEFYWALDTNDWKKNTPAGLVTYIKSQLKEYDHGIILMHDIQHKTALALPQILSELYYGGYNLIILQPSDDQARYNSKIVHLNNGGTQKP